MSMSKDDLHRLLHKALSKPVTRVNFAALRELLEASIDRKCRTNAPNKRNTKSSAEKITQSQTDQIDSDFQPVITDNESNSGPSNDSDGYTSISANIEGIITKTVTIEQEFYLYNGTIKTKLKDTNSETISTEDKENTMDVEQSGEKEMDTHKKPEVNFLLHETRKR